MATKKFKRTTENFVCEECDAPVAGNGYTNHCPQCLVSKHVDVNPGDRAADCGGLMDVCDVELDHGELVFTHGCRDCGHTKRNKSHKDDSVDAITSTMKRVHGKKK